MRYVYNDLEFRVCFYHTKRFNTDNLNDRHPYSEGSLDHTECQVKKYEMKIEVHVNIVLLRK